MNRYNLELPSQQFLFSAHPRNSFSEQHQDELWIGYIPKVVLSIIWA